MLTIKVFLTDGGRVANLEKNFPLYQGQFQNKLIDIYVPTVILSANYTTQHYIGRAEWDETPDDIDNVLATFVEQHTGRTPAKADIVDVELVDDDVVTQRYRYVYDGTTWDGEEVTHFLVNAVAGTNVVLGAVSLERNGAIKKSKGYPARYVKTLSVNGIEYALYERKMPKELTYYSGIGENATKMVINVVDVDLENTAIQQLVTSQTCALDVLPSTVLDAEEPEDATTLEELQAQVNALDNAVGEKQDWSIPDARTADKTVLGAINEIYDMAEDASSLVASLETQVENMEANKQDKAIPDATTTAKTVEGAIDELHTGVVANTATNTQQGVQISGLDLRVTALEETQFTGVNYVGTLTTAENVATDNALDAYVLEIEERAKQKGDRVINIVTIAGATDKVYDCTYTASGWQKIEMPSIESAKNGEKGLVQGTYGIGSTNDILVDIRSGEIKAIYAKKNGTYVDLLTWLGTLQTTADSLVTAISGKQDQSIPTALTTAKTVLGAINELKTAVTIAIGRITAIVDGTQTVGAADKATKDGSGNNIVDTYQTKTAGATKEYVKRYALPRVFNDTLYLGKDDSGFIFTETVQDDVNEYTDVGIGYTKIMEAVYTLDRFEFQLSKKNGCQNSYYVEYDGTDEVRFLLSTYADNGGDEEILLGTTLSEPMTFTASTPKRIDFATIFSGLGEDVISLQPTNTIFQTLEISRTVSTSATAHVLSDTAMPTVMTMNTGVLRVVLAEGAILMYDTASDFPEIGNADTFYFARDTRTLYSWDETQTDYLPLNAGDEELESRVATLEADITSLGGRMTNAESDIDDLGQSVDSLETTVSGHTTSIATNATNIANEATARANADLAIKTIGVWYEEV